MCENHAQPKTEYQLRIRQMLKHVRDRPLAGRLTLLQPLEGHAAQAFAQCPSVALSTLVGSRSPSKSSRAETYCAVSSGVELACW